MPKLDLEKTLSEIARIQMERDQLLLQLGGFHHRHGWCILSMTMEDLPERYRDSASAEDMDFIRDEVSDQVLDVLAGCTSSDGCLNLTESLAKAASNGEVRLKTRRDPNYALIERLSEEGHRDNPLHEPARRLADAKTTLSIVKRERDRLLLQLGGSDLWAVVRANFQYLPEPYATTATIADMQEIVADAEWSIERFLENNGDYDDGQTFRQIIETTSLNYFTETP